MLKVTVKNTIVPDERLERGMIRMSIDGETVVMITSDIVSKGAKIIFLKAKSTMSIGYVEDYSKEYILRTFPIVVENAELIIGGGNSD